MANLKVLGSGVSVVSINELDYISITDIAKYRNAGQSDDLIRGWLRNRNTIEFLGIWEQLNNLGFKPVEFDGFKKLAGLNSFTLTPMLSCGCDTLELCMAAPLPDNMVPQS